MQDAKYQTLQEPARRIAYLPITQENVDRNLFAEVRPLGRPSSIVERIRAEARAMDAGVPIRIETVADRIHESLVKERVMAVLASGLGFTALALACAGLYGLLAYAVSRQAKEIGLRLALGATRAAVLWIVLARLPDCRRDRDNARNRRLSGAGALRANAALPGHRHRRDFAGNRRSAHARRRNPRRFPAGPPRRDRRPSRGAAGVRRGRISTSSGDQPPFACHWADVTQEYAFTATCSASSGGDCHGWVSPMRRRPRIRTPTRMIVRARPAAISTDPGTTSNARSAKYACR